MNSVSILLSLGVASLLSPTNCLSLYPSVLSPARTFALRTPLPFQSDAIVQIQASLPQTVQLPSAANPSLSSPLEEESGPRPSSTLPPPHPGIELTPIFGHPPTNELHPFYNLVAAQLATIIWRYEESPPTGADDFSAATTGAGGTGTYGGTRRPVIVGLAFKYGNLSDDMKMEATFRGIAEVVIRLLNTS